jgi:hypothetical protein
MKKLSNLLMVIGVILLIGTAGASDIESIGFYEMIKQILVSALFIVSSLLLNRLNCALKCRKKYAPVKQIAYLGSVK